MLLKDPMPTQVNRSISYLAFIELSLAQVFVGFNIVLGKLLLTSVPLLGIMTLRFLFSSLITGSILKVRQESLLPKQLDLQQALLIFVQALCGGILFNLLVLNGLQYTDASSAGIITAMLPCVITMLSVLFFKERLNRLKIGAILFSCISLMTLQLGDVHERIIVSWQSFFGDVLIFFSLFPESLLTLLARYHPSKGSVIQRVFIVNMVNLICLLPFSWQTFAITMTTISLRNILLILLSASSGGILFFALWFKGLKVCNASTASLFTCLMPVSTLVFSSFILGQQLTVLELIGISFVWLSILLSAKAS